MRTRIRTFIYITGKKYDGMIGRCYRKSDSSYVNYGAKGIKVCSEWLKDIEAFRSWVKREVLRAGISAHDLTKAGSGIQLDRIDPNGHYSPENCRLISRQDNVRNRRKSKGTVLVSAEGETIVFGKVS